MPDVSYRVVEQIHDEKPEFWYVDQNMDIDEYYDHVDYDDKVCEDCGCPDIEEKREKWYRVNGGEFISDGESDPYYWCSYCEINNIFIIEFNEWKKHYEEKFFVEKGEG